MSVFGPLVSASWLASNIEHVRVVDVRWYLDGRSGRVAYEAGHLPGAVWLDIDTDLSAPATRADGRHPLPTPEDFAAALGRAGIATGTPVVAYDDSGGGTAARLWWLLHALGEPVAVLDGGLGAWTGPLTTDLPVLEPASREPQPWPSGMFVDADEVARTEATVLDARTPQRYAQGDPAIDPRPGHVPGAVSAPWQQNLDEQGRFHSAAELASRFEPGAYVAYCGSGVTACHDLLALTIAGRTDLALYPGSWSQWGADESRPAEVS